MKKVMFCLAVAGMFAFAACGTKTATEEKTCEATSEEVVATEAPATENVECAASAEATTAEVAVEETANTEASNQ